MFETLFVFTGKVFVIFIAVAAILILIAVLVSRVQKEKEEIEVEVLHDKFKERQISLKTFFAHSKAAKKELKKLLKQEHKFDRKVYVVNFHGDLKASATDSLREEITSILTVAKPQDEVVICLESQGGFVHSYGFAASQLERVRNRGIPLTVCVDKVAASGGYLMASVANKIVAAPFAIIGSIGVAAPVPNFSKILKKWDVDYKEYTAGEFKRTLTMFDEKSPEKEKKFIEELEITHSLFKSFVKKYRSQLDISRVSTGEHWYGENAKDLNLIDMISSSDDYLLKQVENSEIYKVKFNRKKSIGDKLGEFIRLQVNSIFESLIQRF